MLYFITFDSAGNPTGAGCYSNAEDAPNPLPAGEVECTAEQFANWKSYVLENGQIVGAPAATLLAAAQAAQIAVIYAACQEQIVGGFSSSALGSAHTYPSTDVDQRNLLSAVTASQGQSASWTTSLWCASGTPLSWSFTSHTAAQVQQVNADWLAFRVAAQQKYANLVEQINAATTVSAVQAITW